MQSKAGQRERRAEAGERLAEVPKARVSEMKKRNKRREGGDREVLGIHLSLIIWLRGWPKSPIQPGWLALDGWRWKPALSP